MFLVAPVFSGPLPGHRLPTGQEQPVREQQVDIKQLSANLKIDMERQTANGSVTIAFTPLQAGLNPLIFDVADIDIKEVELVGAASAKLDFLVSDRKLQIAMPVATLLGIPGGFGVTWLGSRFGYFKR